MKQEKDFALLEWCKSKDIDIVSLTSTLQTTTDINAKNDHGVTALHYLCMNPKVNLELIKVLLEKHADHNITEGGQTPLTWLFRTSRDSLSTGVALYLIQVTENINIQCRVTKASVHVTGINLYNQACALTLTQMSK